MLRLALQRGLSDAFTKHGLAQPSLATVGISTPVKAPGLPSPGKAPPLPKPSVNAAGVPSDAAIAPSLGQRAAKVAANVGMMASTQGPEGIGASRGEPADEGRRQRSVIDRTFQANEDNFATSAMPMPGSVSP